MFHGTDGFFFNSIEIYDFILGIVDGKEISPNFYDGWKVCQITDTVSGIDNKIKKNLLNLVFAAHYRRKVIVEVGFYIGDILDFISKNDDYQHMFASPNDGADDHVISSCATKLSVK